jgi:hypothetical protein
LVVRTGENIELLSRNIPITCYTFIFKDNYSSV